MSPRSFHARRVWGFFGTLLSAAVLLFAIVAIASAEPPAPVAAPSGGTAEADPLLDLGRRLASPAASPTAAKPALVVPSTSPVSAAPSQGQALPPPSGRSSPLGPGPSSPRDGQNTTDGNWWMSTGLALAGVLALIFTLRSAFARWTGRTPTLSRSVAVEVLARVPVAPRNHVLLLRLGHRILVVGDSPAGLRTLANVKDAEEVATILSAISAGKPGSVSESFRQLVNRFDDEHDSAATQGGDEEEFHIDNARDRVSGLLARVRSTSGGRKPR